MKPEDGAGAQICEEAHPDGVSGAGGPQATPTEPKLAVPVGVPPELTQVPPDPVGPWGT